MVVEPLQAQGSGKSVREREQGDGDGRRTSHSGIASQTLGPGESVVCPLCTRKRSSGRGLSRWGRCRQSDVDPLVAKELDQFPSMGASLPVSPQDGVGSQRHLRWVVKRRCRASGMQHGANASWFFAGGPMPLTLVPQWTGTTMANASSIQDPHGSIPLRTPFLWVERRAGRTAQRAIGLGGKVTTFQATLFPGGGKGGRPIAGR